MHYPDLQGKIQNCKGAADEAAALLAWRAARSCDGLGIVRSQGSLVSPLLTRCPFSSFRMPTKQTHPQDQKKRKKKEKRQDSLRGRGRVASGDLSRECCSVRALVAPLATGDTNRCVRTNAALTACNPTAGRGFWASRPNHGQFDAARAQTRVEYHKTNTNRK
ncbi:hypothetical protein pneo_cds_881 [Pandoravirus neocaledonia]|uniref:Uncharacterized protein n=1 Tax=Pandoravirus neocaledonia TaxID=2107708 RepID=A0A2U7UDE3_9VIRU|nr:hypothetical protein pneo_cds_881 [Pandoravirus neocaledonia]AVK76488.1 hypothetical protein pneo_cds_881 [Pandoravirus neocaledonia]